MTTLKGKEKKILVAGAAYTELYFESSAFPSPGKKEQSFGMKKRFSGKGVNQAVAVARLGAPVSLIARVGGDCFGEQIKERLKEEGVDNKDVGTTLSLPTGMAVTDTLSTGEKAGIVYVGANAALTSDDLERGDSLFQEAAMLLLQLESPLSVSISAAERARRYGCPVMLCASPLPSTPLPHILLEMTDILVTTAEEASVIAGIEIKDDASTLEAICRIKDIGVREVIVIRPNRDICYSDTGRLCKVRSQKVRVVDASGSSDAFCAALAVKLTEECTLRDSLSFASHAAALASTLHGAMNSMPYLKDITEND